MNYNPVVLNTKDVETGEHWSPREMNEFEITGIELYLKKQTRRTVGDFTIYTGCKLWLDNPQIYAVHLPELPEEYKHWNLVHLFLTGKETLVAQIAHPDDDECDNAVYVRLY